MTRKAQLVNNIIIFVVGLIVVGLVFLFGYNVLEIFSEDRCEVQRLQFATDLDSAIELNKDWGSNRVVRLTPPCEVAQVCFVDRRIVDGDVEAAVMNSFASTIDARTYTLRAQQTINDSVWVNKDLPAEAQREYTNVFTITEDGEVDPIERYSTQAAAIRVEEDSDVAAQCFSLINNQVQLRMQGNGQTARVRAVE